MKRYFILFFVVVTLFLVACTSVQESASLQEPSERDTLAQARTQLTNENCELKETAFEKEDCYYQKAVIFEDISFCEKIEDFEHFGTKIKCLDALKKCEELTTTEEKDSCYNDKSIVRSNVAGALDLGSEYLTAYCDKIIEPVIKDTCFMFIAQSWGEPDVCEKLSGEGTHPFVGPITKSTCYLNIASVGYEDFRICEKIVSSKAEAESCWFNVMKTEVACIIGDSEHRCRWDSYELAESINEVEKQAVLSQDESKCDSIPTALSHDGCYAIVAVKKADATICNGLQTSILKSKCIGFVGITKKDAGLCEQQGSAQEKDECYNSYARMNKDTTACERIQESGLKEGCSAAVAELMTYSS